MPLYEYQCESCDRRFERIRKFSDPPLTECPECGKGPVRKLLSSPAIQFKGSGFYITDYAKPGSKSESDKSESDSSGKKDAPASSSDSSTKSETKSEKTESPSSSTKSDSKSDSTTTTSKSTDKT